jgi:hypothetical protein
MIDSYEADIKIIGAKKFDLSGNSSLLRVKYLDFSSSGENSTVVYGWAGPLDKIGEIESEINAMKARRIEITLRFETIVIIDKRTDEEKEHGWITNIYTDSIKNERVFATFDEFVSVVRHLRENEVSE